MIPFLKSRHKFILLFFYFIYRISVMRYISQKEFIEHLETNDQEKWRGNVCGLACVASIIESEESTKILTAIVSDSWWDEQYWWKHRSLVGFLRDQWLRAETFSYRFFPTFLKKQLSKKFIVIASMKSTEWWHLVIITGFDPETDTVQFYDPGTKTTEAQVMNLPWGTFLPLWKRRGILITNHDSHL